MVQTLAPFRCNVTMAAKGREINAKSMNYPEQGLDQLPATAAAGTRNGAIVDDA
ncbi:hypothetical protein C7E25_22290 [Stenotrophomonas maltophilia]|nr:hypothetical protein C7E25_22290 [Stenotrophomonas maltophilia]